MAKLSQGFVDPVDDKCASGKTHTDTYINIVEIHLIPMDPVALTLKVEQKVALTGLAGLAR